MHQGCEFDSLIGHTQETANECMNGWSVFPSLSLKINNKFFLKFRLHQLKLYSFGIGYYDFPFSILKKYIFLEGHAIFRHEIMKHFIFEVSILAF